MGFPGLRHFKGSQSQRVLDGLSGSWRVLAGLLGLEKPCWALVWVLVGLERYQQVKAGLNGYWKVSAGLVSCEHNLMGLIRGGRF